MKCTIENHAGRLRLRWRYKGKRYTLGCGVPDNPMGWAVARQKASQIELDLQAGYFDPTLLKYKPRTLGKSATEVTAPELFEKFIQHKLKNEGISPRSVETRYQPLLGYLRRSLNLPAVAVTGTKTRNFKALLLERLVPQTVKAHLWLLKSCWEWAKGKYHTAPDNPWEGLTDGIKPQPQQKVKPFSVAEVRAILDGFKSDRYYRHYYPFVAFLFGTGVRIGEAAGLKWKHLSDNFQTAWIGESVSRGTRKSTKTGKARTILLSDSVQSLLRERFEAAKPQPEALVFSAPKGGPISDRNPFCSDFCNSVSS